MKKFIYIFTGAVIIAMIAAISIQGYLKKQIYPTEYKQLVEKYSEQFDIDKQLVYAVIKAESNFNKDAVSSAKAYGLMQLTFETYQWLNYLNKNNDELSEKELFDPETNIKFGCQLLSMNIKDYRNKNTALAAYNAGRGRVNQWLKDSRYSDDGVQLFEIPYTETKMYVDKVIKFEKIYNKLYEGE